MPTYSNPNGVTAPVYAPEGRGLAVFRQVIAMATGDLDINDTFDICRLPVGARVIDIICAVTDMDSASTGTINIGDAGSAARFIQAGSIQAAAVLRAGNNATSAATFAAHTPYTAETLIQGYVLAAPTAVAGTIVVSVLYCCED